MPLPVSTRSGNSGHGWEDSYVLPKMNPDIQTLSDGRFYERLDQYFSSTTLSAAGRAFESMIDKELYERLDSDWSHGWDFEIRDEFFGDRGVSILIQNLKLDWLPIWEWLTAKMADIPAGAAINFEVFDNIHNGVMDASEMVLRRVIFSDGIVEEATD